MSSNVMMIDGFKAVISFDAEIEMFRGEFVGLNGGADFYADNIDKLKTEGAASLAVFLDECSTRGIEPRKSFSGNIPLRITEDIHEQAYIAAQSEDVSVNKLVTKALVSYLQN